MLRNAADQNHPELRQPDRPHPHHQPDQQDQTAVDLELAQDLDAALQPGPDQSAHTTALAPTTLPTEEPAEKPAEEPAQEPAKEPTAEPSPGGAATDLREPPLPTGPAGPTGTGPTEPWTAFLWAPPELRPVLQALLAFAQRPYLDPPDARWVVRRWPDLAATCVATTFFWFSLTPSLVPRPWYLQGLIGGIAATMGYALGALLSCLFRALSPWVPTELLRARCWQLYLVISPLVAVTLLSQSAQLQRELRELHELPPTLTWHSLMILLITMALCALMVLIARTVRLGTRTLITGLTQLVPKPAAVVIGLLVSALVTVVGARDVVFDRGIIDVASHIAANTDQGTKDGIVQPNSPLVSGSPASLVPWEDLGYQGRNFTGTVISAQQISSVTHRPAMDPIRVYVGQSGQDSFADQAETAVRELRRTGAFDREVLAIAGTTASGWINSTVAEPLEYLHGGDTAIVGMQYSYLPSWVSFIVDREIAGRATRELVEAVLSAWQERPESDRPRLVVFGESMGVYGIEESFDGLSDLLDKTDGALLVGPPNFSPIWGDLTEHRDPGSPVWRPEYQRGEHVRFAQFPERDLQRPGGDWRFPRVVYLQNASDPIVWWSPDLALQRPQWLEEPKGPDVSGQVSWFPFVTFWQTAVDMAVSYGAPAPHGHRYGTNAVEGWSSVAPPDGWSDADLHRLKAFMEAREAPY